MKPKQQIRNEEKQVEGFLLKSEIARRLHRTPRTIERWMRQNRLPYLKLGRGRRASVLYNWPKIVAALERQFERGPAV